MGAPREDAVSISVPSWIDDLVGNFEGPLETDEQRMAMAVALARSNVERGGGPFGAVVFRDATLVGACVNCVLASGLSIAHAEILALMRAQQRARAESSRTTGTLTLVTSTEPCCQCFGAIVWSGIDRLVCAATTADAEAIGFDEGPKPDRWPELLEARGIGVRREVLRDQARAVLNDYVRAGGVIYGLRHGS
jgi:tRNA(Arg) A34 adenosine deaminase TadA